MELNQPSRGFTETNRHGLIDELLARGKPPFYFKMRMVSKGPYVACKVGRMCVCTVNGGDENASHEWSESCDRFPPIASEINGESFPLERAIAGRQLGTITKAEYEYLLDSAAWDAAHDENSPLAEPMQRIDLNRLKPMF